MSSNSDRLKPEANSKRIDFVAIATSVLPAFMLWTVLVISATFGGRQPGVICATPVAWGLAAWIGPRCVLRSSNARKSGRLMEAALAGGIFGLLTGVLFAALTPYMGTIKPEEQRNEIILSVLMIVLGAIVSAVLSMAIGATLERRRAAK